MSTDNKKTDLIEKQDYDIVFQMGVIKLAIQDDYFCTQLVKYLNDDKDLEEYTIFDNENLQTVFKYISESFHKFNSRPTEGQLRQTFNDKNDENEKKDLHDTLDMVLNQDVHNDQFYRDHLRAYIQFVKSAKGLVKARRAFKEKPSETPDIMQSIIDGIRRVSFDKEDIVTLKDLPGLITEGAAINTRKIPTGIIQLDKDLVGGLPRENLTVVLAGTNVGKSLFCISLGCQALKACDENGVNLGLKVLHINLEGQRDEAIKRYAANLAKINYVNLLKGDFDEPAKKRLEDVMNLFDENRLLVRNMLGFGATVEDLIAYCRELYKNFRFDMVVVDYGQLLETKMKTDGLRFTMNRVFRGLDSISKEFGCVVISPAQSTRGGQESQQQSFKGGRPVDGLLKAPVLRSTDISEAFEIARVSGVIITLNRTEEEEKTNKLRVYLEKQRQGAKNILYGLYTNYSQSNLITGKTYNPLEVVHDADAGNNRQENSIKDLTKNLKNFKDLPKPKNTLTAQKVEMTPENEMISFFDRLDQEFITIKESYSRLRNNYDDLREDDAADPAELDNLKHQLTTIQARAKDILAEAKGLIYQAYPQATKELLENMKSQLKDLKISNGNKNSIEELERKIRHLELGFNITKVPG
jgi:replicative DNA helicase